MGKQITPIQPPQAGLKFQFFLDHASWGVEVGGDKQAGCWIGMRRAVMFSLGAALMLSHYIRLLFYDFKKWPNDTSMSSPWETSLGTGHENISIRKLDHESV